MTLPILLETPDFLVIDKPAGIVTDKSNTNNETTVEDIAREQFGIKIDRGGIVHRLDKDTSGVLVIAKTQKALENLQFQFKERMTKKEYLCLVHGFMNKTEVVKGAIGRNPRNRQKFTVLEDGKESETEFIPLECRMMNAEFRMKLTEGMTKNALRKLERSEYGKFTLVRAIPHTGRTHQIRVHLKHIGFSLVGDDKYGGRKTVRWDHRFCHRQFLHAAKLEFYDPINGEKVSVESPLAEDLAKALGSLEKV